MKLKLQASEQELKLRQQEQQLAAMLQEQKDNQQDNHKMQMQHKQDMEHISSMLAGSEAQLSQVKAELYAERQTTDTMVRVQSPLTFLLLPYLLFPLTLYSH